MTEQHLDRAEIGADYEQMNGEGVTERIRSQWFA
jgi:hypothetical protein